MTTQTEALKLALEALENLIPIGERTATLQTKAITAIKEALAQPALPLEHEWLRGECVNCGQSIERQEPVAWPVEEQPDGSIIPVDPSEMTTEQLQRYTTPPQRTWVGLTNEDIRQLEKENTVGGYHGDYCPTWDLIEATEAKLKEKNTNA